MSLCPNCKCREWHSFEKNEQKENVRLQCNSCGYIYPAKFSPWMLKAQEMVSETWEVVHNMDENEARNKLVARVAIELMNARSREHEHGGYREQNESQSALQSLRASTAREDEELAKSSIERRNFIEEAIEEKLKKERH